MTNKRPVNLNLFTIAFPLPAIVSILHRISGVILFLLIPLLLVLLTRSLDAHGFHQIGVFFAHPVVKFCVWGLLLALFYHLIAGIRHLLMDCHCGDSLQGGRLGAKLVLLATFIVAILLGIWLW